MQIIYLYLKLELCCTSTKEYIYNSPPPPPTKQLKKINEKYKR